MKTLPNTRWFWVKGITDRPFKRSDKKGFIIDACGKEAELWEGAEFEPIKNSPFKPPAIDSIKTEWFWVEGIAAPCHRGNNTSVVTDNCTLYTIRPDMKFSEIPN